MRGFLNPARQPSQVTINVHGTEKQILHHVTPVQILAHTHNIIMPSEQMDPNAIFDEFLPHKGGSSLLMPAKDTTWEYLFNKECAVV